MHKILCDEREWTGADGYSFGSPLGLGMLIQGTVVIGTNKETGEEVIAEFNGDDTFRMDLEKEIQIGEHLVALPGSWVDGSSVVHGPLIYHGIRIPADGGVHFNGCAFSHDGSDKPENPYYREECIEYLLLQNNFQDLEL